MKSMRDFEAWLKAVKQWLKRLPLIVISGVFLVRILRGWRAYRGILRACPPEDGWRVWFMDYDGSGDTYLTCGYLQSRGLLGPKDAFAGSEGPSMKVARLLGFDRYVAVKQKAVLDMRLMERFYGRRLKLLPLLYESDYLEHSGVVRHMAGVHDIDFMTMLRIGLEANCGVPYEEGPWAQPVFTYDEEEIDAIFEEYELVPGKTVLLAPYAGKSDMWDIPMAFYTKLADKLHAAGFSVSTNASGAKELAVPGTKPLLVPYRLARPFCERAGTFIGLRSGLCDIISGARCRKVILYSNKFKTGGPCTWQEFFSLRNMGLCGDVVESYVDGQNSSRAVLEIIQALSTDT